MRRLQLEVVLSWMRSVSLSSMVDLRYRSTRSKAIQCSLHAHLAKCDRYCTEKRISGRVQRAIQSSCPSNWRYGSLGAYACRRTCFR
eukprot:6970857-Pyramimonas_sp.AAC.1